MKFHQCVLLTIMKKRYVVIMAGGAGERFWPLSRIAKPKHLWNVFGGDKCILEQTIERACKIVDLKNIIIITNKEQVAGIIEKCPNFPKENIIAEPTGRDTTAAIGLASVIVGMRANDENASFVVLSSDHIIHDIDAFADTINCAFEKAESGDFLVTVGINPTFPATGFGYIKRGDAQRLSLGECYKVERFYEKPNLERAKSYIESGSFSWNAGMFIWKVSSINSAIQRNAPKIFQSLVNIKNDISKGISIDTVLQNHYPNIEKISIDFSVMERADNVWVVPSRFDWDDAGSWNAIERHLPKDENNSVAIGEYYSQNAKSNTIFDSTASRATVVSGLSNIVVIHTNDATLVCSKTDAEKLRDLVRSLPQKYR